MVVETLRWVALSRDSLPSVILVIDTFASRQDHKHRAIFFQLQTGLVASANRRMRILELINRRNQEMWAGTWYLDGEDVLTCDWVPNMTERGLPWENLDDAMERMLVGWLDFYPRIKLLVSSFGQSRLMLPFPGDRRAGVAPAQKSSTSTHLRRTDRKIRR